jgi:CRISPR-associated protein Csb2
MALVLEIEYLLGVAFAAQGPDSAESDWPPQPDRIFSAFVAAWASRGEVAAERAALEWLECQDPPEIEASGHARRPAAANFVPVNDPATGTKGNRAVMPGYRPRQPRRFPAALPFDPTVRLVWNGAGSQHLEALDALARDVPYLGHSASLTRCRFLSDEGREPLGPDRNSVGSRARRGIYRGRLRELEARFHAGRRPLPGNDIRWPEPNREQPRDWLVLEMNDDPPNQVEGEPLLGRTIDLRAAPLACKTLRYAIMSGYGRAGLAVPEWVSGHQTDGVPSKDDHLAIVPLAYVGFTHADGQLMGFGLIAPPGRRLLEDEAFLRAMGKLVELGGDHLTLRLGQGTELTLLPSLAPSHRSLEPERYRHAAKVWSTVTPLVLDRHLKDGDGPAEIVAMVEAAALRATGVPTARVAVHKHAAIKGAPSAMPSGRAPRWTGWTVPPKLRSRRLVHATLAFSQEVAGPVLIGAGRFSGLGLCLPLSGEP